MNANTRNIPRNKIKKSTNSSESIVSAIATFCILLFHLITPTHTATAETGTIAIVAKVNKDIITSYDLEQEMELFRILKGDPVKKASKGEIRQFVLQGLTRAKMQERYLKLINISVDDAILDKHLKSNVAFQKILKKLNGHPRQGVLKKYLTRQAKREALWGEVIQKVIMPQITIDDSEVETLGKSQKISKSAAREHLIKIKISSLEKDILGEMRKTSYIEILK